MEAKTKIMAAVAVIVMCAAGLVGAGYAYTASTQNDGNNAAAEYVVLSQTGEGAYTFVNNQNVYYNTVNVSSSATGTTYTLDNAKILGDYTVVKLGKTFTVVATQTPANAAIEDMECTIALAAGTVTLASGYKLIFKVTNDDDVSYHVYDGSNWNDATFTIQVNTSENPDVYFDSTIEVYYGYPTGQAPTTNVAPPAVPLSSAKFTFSVEKATLHNNFQVILGDAIADGVKKLSDVSVVVKSLDDTPLTKDTDYTIAWSVGGTPVADTTVLVSGTVYDILITGAGGYLGLFCEGSVTAAAA